MTEANYLRPDITVAPTLWTYRDVVDHLVDYAGGSGTAANQREFRRAILLAYQEVGNARSWSYFVKHGRVNLVAAYSTGTAAYDFSGGTTCERQLTLTAGTWPSWAAFGTVIIAGVAYRVQATTSSSAVLQLDPLHCPQADVDAGTDYQIYRSIYPLPADFVSIFSVENENGVDYLSYISPQDWLTRERQNQSSGTPYYWTIMADDNTIGSNSLRVHYPSDAARTLDFIYHSRPRPLKLHGYAADHYAGTFSTTAGSTATTGTSVVWGVDSVGAVLRINSGSSSVPPDGIEGNSPYTEQRIVNRRASNTSIAVDRAWGTTITGKKGVVSDPIDLPEQLMNYFLRECEYQVAVIKKMSDAQVTRAAQARDLAYMTACEADSTNSSRRSPFSGPRTRRLSDMPIGSYVGD